MYMCRNTYTWPVWYRQFIHIYMTCLEKAIYTHIHRLLCTGNLYTYTWPVWSRQHIHIYITVHKLPVPNRSYICVEIACTKQVLYMCINCLYQTGDVYVYYRQFIHIYITGLVQEMYTHIHDLFGTGNFYTYTWPVWYRKFIHIYITCLVQEIYTHIHHNRSCICVEIASTKQVMYMCIHFLYQTGDVYVYDLPVPNRSCICV
jgi:hypothetical protein